MSLLGGAGKEAGSDAAREIHDAVSEAVPQVTGALKSAEDAVTQITDKGLAAIADAVSQLESLMYRLDGATLKVEGVNVTSPVTITFQLGPYKPE